MSRVEAVIVAGGLGSRLRPLTDHRPKHLLAVAGIPLVAHQLAKLATAGVRRVLLATSYHADQFEPTLGDGSQWGIDLVYVREDVPLGTGGAIRNVADRLQSAGDDPVVILNGDILSGHDLGAQVDRHRETAADVTLHLVEVPDARAYGCVPTDAQGRVTAFLEKDPHPVTQQINAGCYVFARQLVDQIPGERVVSVERETFPDMLGAGVRVMSFVGNDYWIDVGTPDALRRASCDLVVGLATSPAYRHPPSTAYVASDAVVAADAQVLGGTAVGRRAVVGDGAVVDASVLAASSSIGARARVIRCVLGEGAAVSAGMQVEDRVLADGEGLGPESSAQ